jgi:DNA-binding MarR family transcriptional regulator
MADITSDLLRALLTVNGRAAFPAEKLARIIQAGGASEKQLAAYNMCDGNRGQGEIAKALSLDAGNFSRTVGRWIDAGIVFRLGDGRDAKLMHVYPLPKESAKKTSTESLQKPKQSTATKNAEKEPSGE